jgi:hypothetical protein
MPKVDIWKKRYTAREFYSSQIPTIQQINHITDCLNYLPIQHTDKNKNLPNHLVLLLTPNDTDLKKHLVLNLFHDPEKIEHFTGLYEAPYLFLITDILKYNSRFKNYESVEKDSTFLTHIGLTTGVILSQALEVGLNVSQIACTSTDVHANLEINSMLNNRFSREISRLRTIHRTKIKIEQVRMGIGIGFAKPLSSEFTRKTHPELDVFFYPSRRFRKKQPFMFVK